MTLSVNPPINLTLLDGLRASCAAIDEAASKGPLDAQVRWYPGADVAEILRHVGVVHRLVRQWVSEGHRPATLPVMPAGTDVREWFATGWEPLLSTLSGFDPADEVSTWCTYDTTAGFWWRRMAHETAIHAVDVLDAVGWSWPSSDEFALDGIDEALRLWLGVALGPDVRGTGQVVRVVAPQQYWTVGLNDHNVEVGHLPVPPDATISADAPTLYRWLWGRADDADVTVTGAAPAAAALRSALARAMQ